MTDAAVITDPPRLQRQPTICFRSAEASKQSSIDEEHPTTVLYENEEDEDTGDVTGKYDIICAEKKKDIEGRK